MKCVSCRVRLRVYRRNYIINLSCTWTQCSKVENLVVMGIKCINLKTWNL